MPETTSQDSTVHFIDDDSLARDSIAALVQPMGMHTRSFDSAEAFLTTAARDARGCLIYDNRMNGMSGVELLEHLRPAVIPLPFVLINAYADVPLAFRVLRSGAVTLLDNPYRDNELWDVIRKALDVEPRHRDRW